MENSKSIFYFVSICFHVRIFWQKKSVANFNFSFSDHMDRFPAPNPFLSVGTYTLGSKAPARGHAVIFDTNSSGWIYPTAGYIVGDSTYNGNMLQLESPVSVNMNNITLTPDAVGVTMGADAFILDKVCWFNRLKVGKSTRVPRQFMKVQELILGIILPRW